MNKKDYQLFAEVLSKIEDTTTREDFINFLIPIFETDNYKFNAIIFREFIKRRINKEDLKGLRVNKKYLYNLN
jgi:hypothetical protein